MSHRARARLMVLLLGVVTLAASAACSTPQPPTVMDTPTIVWADGVEPSSPLEADPLVQAARAGEVGRAMAFNSGDFTIAQLTDNVSTRLIDALADGYAKQMDETYIYAGPEPWQPISIEHTENGGRIKTCALNQFRPELGEKEDGSGVGPYDRELAWDKWITVENIDGKLKIVRFDIDGDADEAIGGADMCDGWSVPVGFFDPEPVAPEGPITKPVRAPEGWKQGKPRE